MYWLIDWLIDLIQKGFSEKSAFSKNCWEVFINTDKRSSIFVEGFSPSFIPTFFVMTIIQWRPYGAIQIRLLLLLFITIIIKQTSTDWLILSLCYSFNVDQMADNSLIRGRWIDDRLLMFRLCISLQLIQLNE